MEKKYENIPTHEVNRLTYVKEVIQGMQCCEIDRKTKIFYFNKDLFRKDFDEKDFDNLCNELKQQIFDKKFSLKPQTNRQWLESLSDEELALIYAKRARCNACHLYSYCNKHSQENCYGNILKWLQAEHKE